jgi:hypothetical protein
MPLYVCLFRVCNSTRFCRLRRFLEHTYWHASVVECEVNAGAVFLNDFFDLGPSVRLYAIDSRVWEGRAPAATTLEEAYKEAMRFDSEHADVKRGKTLSGCDAAASVVRGLGYESRWGLMTCTELGMRLEGGELGAVVCNRFNARIYPEKLEDSSAVDRGNDPVWR